MKNKIILILRECAFWGGIVGLASFVLGLWMLLLGTWSLAEGGQDSCAKMAAVVLKSCGSLFYK
jgi:hypothetical protein